MLDATREKRDGEKLSSVSGDHTDFNCWGDDEVGIGGIWGAAPEVEYVEKSTGLPSTAVCGLMTLLARSSEGREIPMTIGLSLGDRSCCRDFWDAFFLCPILDGFFLSHAQLPTVADVGSPSSALKAAASTNLPVLSSCGPADLSC